MVAVDCCLFFEVDCFVNLLRSFWLINKQLYYKWLIGNSKNESWLRRFSVTSFVRINQKHVLNRHHKELSFCTLDLP